MIPTFRGVGSVYPSIRCILGDIRLWVGDPSTSSCLVPLRQVYHIYKKGYTTNRVHPDIEHWLQRDPDAGPSHTLGPHKLPRQVVNPFVGLRAPSSGGAAPIVLDKCILGFEVGRGTARAKDAQGTPTQSHISRSILVYEHKCTLGLEVEGSYGEPYH